MLHTPFAIEIAVLLYLQHSADMALASQHTLLTAMTNVWPSKLNDLHLRAHLGMEQRQPLPARLVLVLLPLLACSLTVFCPGHQHLYQFCP